MSLPQRILPQVAYSLVGEEKKKKKTYKNFAVGQEIFKNKRHKY